MHLNYGVLLTNVVLIMWTSSTFSCLLISLAYRYADTNNVCDAPQQTDSTEYAVRFTKYGCM